MGFTTTKGMTEKAHTGPAYRDLPFYERWMIRLTWLCYDPDKRKKWSDVISGMEPHEHNFTIPEKGGLLRCDHPGCNLCDDPEFPFLD